MFLIYVSEMNSITEYPILDLRSDKYIVTEASLDRSLYKTGTLKFKILASHPHYDKVNVLTSAFHVYSLQNGSKKWLYSGRVTTPESDFYNTGTVECEGILAYMLDSTIRPYEFSGTPNDYVTKLIDQHNSQVEDAKRISKGDIDLVDSDNNNYIVRSSTQYPTTLDELEEKIVESLGCYLSVRMEIENNERKYYLDCTSAVPKYNHQKIQFGKNLLDLTKTKSGEDIRTAIIPLGEKDDDTEERLTIKYYCPTSKPDDWADKYKDYCTRKELASGEYEYTFVTLSTAPTWKADTYYYGLDYVYNQSAVNEYGWIFGTNDWDDVTLQENLFRKGVQYCDACLLSETTEIKAIDLGMVDADVEGLELGWTHVYTKPHDLDTYMLLYEITYNLLNAGDTQLTLGNEIQKFSSTTAKKQSETATKMENMSGDMYSAIKNATQLMTGAKGGYFVIGTTDDGVPNETFWMDAPSTELAQNIMRANKNGIGFSNSGIDGPYENAWTIDGVLLGQFIKAGTVDAEKLSVAYRTSVDTQISVAESNANAYTSNSLTSYYTRLEIDNTLKVTEDGILASAKATAKDIAQNYTDNQLTAYYSAATLDIKFNEIKLDVSTEVTRATGVEETLKSSITANATSIALKVSKGDVSSQLSVESGGITISGDRLVISASNFSLTAAGVMTCTSGTFSGTVTTTNSVSSLKITGGRLYGYYGSSLAGYLDTWVTYNGTRATTLAGYGAINLVAPNLTVYDGWVDPGSTYTVSVGQTGSIYVTYNLSISANSSGGVDWSYAHKTLKFVNGLMVTAL